ncbi:MAG TPA: PAS domain S-box protein [Alphaproteobacteria bacterium]|nr:PAS domain S-box protein [Alphaproteobacteria bacterium]
MSLFHRIRGYLVLILALVLFSLSIFFSFNKMLKEQGEFSGTVQEDMVWATTQSEVALFYFLDGLREYGTKDSAITLDEVQQRLDLLIGQARRLSTGDIGAQLNQIPGAQKTVAQLLDSSQAVETVLLTVKKGDRPATQELIDRLRDYTQTLNQLNVDVVHWENKFAEARQERLKNVYFQLILYFIGAFAGGSVLLLLLFNGIRRANNLLYERELTEERLRESEQRFRDYAASSSDWLWETDAKNRFTYISKGYLEKIGLSAVEVIGKTHEDIALKDAADAAAWSRQREALAQHKPFREFTYRMRVYGVERHIKVSGVPIVDVEGKFLGYRGTGTDMTAQVQAEAEAVRARTLLSKAVESIDEGFVVFDAEDRLVQWNSRFAGFYLDAANALVPGASFEEITRAAAYRGVFPDAAGREEAWIAARLEQHRNPQQAADVLLRDGRWMQSRETPLDNDWRVGTRIDVTDRKRREEALRREALIWEQMSDGVIVTDLNGTITNWNPAAERMFGYAIDEVMGKTPRLLHAAEDQETIDRIFDTLQRDDARADRGDGSDASDGGWSGEIDFRRKDGSAVVAETVVVPLRDDRGKRVAVIWVNHDITLRKQSEAELRAAKEQAEYANQAKSQFLATMSHEIRTPMNGVLGMIGLLLDTSLDEEQRTYARTVRESGEALVTIINDILDFSKMEVGKLVLERTDFDLRQVVEAVADLLAPRAQAKSIEIGSFIAPGVPTALRGDPGRLRQVLLNLAGNAVKFTESGGISVLVSAVETTNERALIEFRIVDTGIGIPESVQGSLFAEFTQADPSHTRRYGGTGLGLAISKKLTELMGGDIGFSSKFGEGSTFWFTIDIERCKPTTDELSLQPYLGSVRALVVDDNAPARDIVERHLTALGLVATGVSGDGATALGILEAAARVGQPYSYALVDQMLGKNSGEKLIREIKASPTVGDTHCVLVVPLGGRGETDQAGRATHDAVLTKPVHQHAVAHCLARLAGVSIELPAPLEPVAAPPTAAPREPLGAELARTRLLLVEDSQVNRMVATAMLSKLVGSIDTAINGVEAVEAMRAKDYDLILMDVSMPEMDGLEATRLIRAMPGPKSRIPIIAMTAHAMEADRQRCFEAGMDDYVTKPIDRARLLKSLTHWMPSKEVAIEIGPSSALEHGVPESATPGGPASAATPKLPASDLAQKPAEVPPSALPEALRLPADLAGRRGKARTPRLIAPATLAAAKTEGLPETRASAGPAGNPGPARTSPEPRVAAAGESESPGPADRGGSGGGNGSGGNDGGGASKPAMPGPALPVLDAAVLGQLEADTDAAVVQELVKTFIVETVERLERIAQAAVARDHATLEREAHALKSSSGTFGAKALQARASELETVARGRDLERAQTLIDGLRPLAAAAAHAMVAHFRSTN